METTRLRKAIKQKSRELFRAKDFFSLMRPCFVMCFVLGIFPYKIQNTSVMCRSKVGYMVSTFIFVIYIFCTVVVLFQTDFGSLKYDSMPGMLQGNFYLILGCSIVIITYLFSDERLNVLQELSNVSAHLSVDTFDKLSKIVHTKDLFGFAFLIGHIINVKSNDVYLCLSKCVSLYTTLFSFVMDMLYANCVCIMNACFTEIDENLKDMKRVAFLGKPSFAFRRVYRDQRNPLLMMELKAIKKQHQRVSDILRLLNDTFGHQMILTSALTFAEVTFNLYFYILENLGDRQINVEKQIWYVHFSTPVAYYALKLGFIVWACEVAKSRAAAIGSTIHMTIINTADKDIKNELQLFSLQVLHRDNTFTSKGLTIDATLLKTIGGSITTYLLILIQFLRDSTAKKEP